ncbi:hypothetical protein R3P38DRAFT_2770892 [Favolaschia claudopus]|uniref:Uncharacterized protein n=1 Tax=Favolaschia claudopus TaxID=2862362 RepID=A0AAW0CBM5_9AGAR
MLDMGTIQGLSLWIITGLVNDAKTVSVSALQSSNSRLPHPNVSIHSTQAGVDVTLGARCSGAYFRWNYFECAAFVSLPGSCCDACRTVDSAVAVVEKWAQQSFGKKFIDRLNHAQLEAKLSALSRQLKAEQIKENNHWTSLKAARKREAAFTELFDLLSAHNVPRLPRLLSTANRSGKRLETQRAGREVKKGDVFA